MANHFVIKHPFAVLQMSFKGWRQKKSIITFLSFERLRTFRSTLETKRSTSLLSLSLLLDIEETVNRVRIIKEWTVTVNNRTS